MSVHCKCNGDECDCYSLHFVGVPQNLWDEKFPKEYIELKRKKNFKPLVIRLGDYYETFFADAETFSRQSGIVAIERRQGVLMCGFKVSDFYKYQKLIKSYKWEIVEDFCKQPLPAPP